MFAVDHAATALLLKKRWPSVDLIWLLISVQALEIFWVILNFVGAEWITTEPSVRYVGDIHLTHMPYSHSLLGALILACLGWLLARVFLKPTTAALAVGVGVLSHIILDLLTHAPDIALFPGSNIYLGLGLYSVSPQLAFAVEIAYGAFCWWVFRGSGALLATIMFFNLANATMFIPQLVGIEGALAGKPSLVVALVAVQIVITLILVGWLASRRRAADSSLS